jgi:glutathione S-transferase
VVDKAKLHYFKGRGRAETTRWMLAVNEIEFENVSLSNPADFENLKSAQKLLFNQLPLLEIDGLNLSQSAAMIGYLARRGGLYGDGAVEAVWCDMIAGATADFNTPAMQFAFQPDPEVAKQGLHASIVKFCPHFARILERNGGEFLVGARRSLADVVLAESLTSYLEIISDCLNDFPGIKDLQARVIAEPGVAAYLRSPNRWRRPDDQYVIDIAAVLERALPAHMPDPDRFIASYLS